MIRLSRISVEDSLLGCRNSRLQIVQLLMERLAFFGQGNLLLHDDPNPKELTNLIKRPAEAGC
jgi:hypothetical protein